MNDLLKQLVGPGRAITVIGDTIIDQSVFVNAHRFAQESPYVPVYRTEGMNMALGGAAGIAIQAAMFGANVRLITTADRTTQAGLRHIASSLGGFSWYNIPVEGYRNEKKLRCYDAEMPNRLLTRIDFAYDREPATEQTLAAWEAQVRGALEQLDGAAESVLVIADYSKGMFDGMSAQWFCTLPHAELIRHVRKRAAFASCDWCVMNAEEAAEVSRLPEMNAEGLHSSAMQALGLAAPHIVVTDGAEPLALLTSDAGSQTVKYSATHWNENLVPVDPVGGSDAVTACLALLRSVDAPVSPDTLMLAGLSCVCKAGPTSAWLPEIASMLLAGSPFDVDNLAALMAQGRGDKTRWNATIGFTNGCFDVLHAGHMHFLRQLQQYCDFLIVAVNDDASVQRLKGDGRPVQSLEQRCAALYSTDLVDAIVIQHEDTPHRLLSAIQPNVLLKGYGYQTPEEAVGHEVVTAYGGAVVVLPDGIPGVSTTQIVNQVKSTL